MMDALDAGAEDLLREDDVFLITCQPADFIQVSKKLQEMGYTFSSAQVGYLPKNKVKVEDEEACSHIEKLISDLEDNDDVQDVYSNWEEA